MHTMMKLSAVFLINSRKTTTQN